MHPKAAEALDRMEVSDAAWIGHALDAIRRICAQRGRGAILTSDPVWEMLRRQDIGQPKEPRAMGVAFRKAQGAGLVEATNETRASVRDANHAQPLRCWRIL